MATGVIAQISEGGQPISFGNSLKSAGEIPVILLPEMNNDELIREDIEAGLEGQYDYRIAKGIHADIHPSNEGIWETLPDGSRLWRVTIKSENAYAMDIFFEKYMLPEGARLFVYNKEKDDILGAFTHNNNKSYGKLAIAPVKGNEITIEYFEPEYVTIPVQLQIGTIGHFYKGNALFGTTGYGDSEKCNKDIICPEGVDWQVEKRSVAMILFKNSAGNSFLCSGALINNARSNGQPYLLTANHCLPTYTEAQTAIYYFNYDSPSCGGPDGDKSQTISGSTILATTNNLDFCLVKLSSTPPASYQPYYSGWDVTTKNPSNCVTIHHPVGDVKKISFYNDVAITGDFVYQWDFDDNTHWFIDRWSKGITQGGSSGSPLYNKDHRIVGDLTGGSTAGNCTSSDAYYAKISHSWDDYSHTTAQLKHWLDPDNTGITFVDGYEPNFSSVNDLSSHQNLFEIYPNPSNGILYIGSNMSDHLPEYVHVYDLSGRRVHSISSASFKNVIQVDLNHLPSGMYIIQAGDDNYLETDRIMIR